LVGLLLISMLDSAGIFQFKVQDTFLLSPINPLLLIVNYVFSLV
jgi:hypothetical protein